MESKSCWRRVTTHVRAVACVTLAVLCAIAAQPQASVIVVKIEGLHSDKGQVLCALFSSAAGFPKRAANALARAQSGISSRHAVCQFPGVAPGTYAVSVIHDENSNGKLDTNFMGIPREGVGASNNAKGRFGPPKFSAAAFPFLGGRLELSVTMTYLFEHRSASPAH